MRTLYVSQQGCYLSLQKELVLIKRGETILDEVQLPLLEQILIFGQSQVTTQVIRACLQRDIPIAYLSRMGYCYGRILPVERGYRHLSRYQQQLLEVDRLVVARTIVQAKLRNSRVILQRQQRRRPSDASTFAIQSLEYLIEQAGQAATLDKLMGMEGAGAASYFSAFGDCLTGDGLVFIARSRRPPGNPVNAMLSFGYQVLWNHLLSLIELQGLDPYQACLHQGSERHAALASDLIEEFRAPVVDSLVLYLANRGIVKADEDFEYHDGGCYLKDMGRKKFLRAFLQRMEEQLQIDEEEQPRWGLLMQQVKAYKQFVYNPAQGYKPYLIR
ncbi:CRISPR-associated endonuclease Cas1 [Leptolyngbya sp. 'hensonii']|uniref:CRISPR-associated endonuclease Cas1 n=1 Tax=Leptolyngbya sp. 'hensonii' TaxID=1922337 RepID=UPI00094FDA6C|nr:CRISPR-associated endonuclease Cas1 [Leptolyngbya sp. 'hensonii']OLP17426.1 CRISPR-associated endonuclease Cas1 [Leptolyngbya sp. 'hensonii']